MAIMNLRDFLKRNGLTHGGFGKTVGLSQGYVSLLVGGKRRPSPDIALRIEKATGGAVTKESLLWPDQEAA